MNATDNSRKIKTIELTNFMNHVNTKFDLADGINLISGSSDNGKTAIIRALRSVLNDKHDSAWIRHGQQEYTVRITFFNGDIIERTKGKRNIIAMYPKNGIAKVAQSYGKDMPQEYKDFIGYIPETSDGPLPFSLQKKDMFLIDKSEVSLGQEISILLQVDDIEKAASNLKKDMTRYNSQIKDHTTEKNNVEEKLIKYEGLEDKVKLFNKLDKILLKHSDLSNTVNQKKQMFDRGLSLRDDYRKINRSLKNYQKIYNLLDGELVDIEEIQSVYEDKKTIIQSAKNYTKNIQDLNTQIMISNEFVEGSIGTLVDEIDVLDNAIKSKKSLLDDINDIDQQKISIDDSISDLRTKINTYNEEIKNLEEQLKITKQLCPSCEGEGFVTIYKAN